MAKEAQWIAALETHIQIQADLLSDLRDYIISRDPSGEEEVELLKQIEDMIGKD